MTRVLNLFIINFCRSVWLLVISKL